MSERGYGIEKVIHFLRDNHGKHYINPDKAGDRADEMKAIQRDGSNARAYFSDFCRKLADQIPELEYVSCSNWLNQGQRIMPYFWVELKYSRWNSFPNSISISINEKDNTGQYTLSVRIDTRNNSSSETDFYRTNRLLDLELEEGMFYQIMYSNQGYDYYPKEEKQYIRREVESGAIKKVEVNFEIENLEQEENDGTLFDKALSCVKKLVPYYEYMMKESNEEGWEPSLSKYDPAISKDMYLEVLTDQDVVKPHWLKALFEMYEYGGIATCKQLETKYGTSAVNYRTYLTSAGRSIAKKYMAPLYEENDHKWLWTVLFTGKHANDDIEGTYVWKMREPLMEALKDLDEQGVYESVKGGVGQMPQNNNYPLNQILYGPPGTGKTYNTVNYAVAICDGRAVSDVESSPYSETLDRFNELKKEKRIAFTTFHQSYGYEEFIEGIKPKLGDEEGLGYSIENGIFKEMCERAAEVTVKTYSGAHISESPTIWGMLLDGTGYSAVKEDCFRNNCIKLGFKEYKDDDLGSSDATAKARKMIFQFKEEMQIGDVVLIEKTFHSIDAIGVVTGEYEYDEGASDGFPRKRSVEWLFTDKEVDIIPYLPNNRKKLARFSIFNFSYLGMDTVSTILGDAGDSQVEVEKETKP